MTNLKTDSFFLCNRCRVEFYCSKKCQINAFPAHRFNCFELPSLCPILKNGLKLAETPDKISNSEVAVQNVEPPSLIPDTADEAQANETPAEVNNKVIEVMPKIEEDKKEPAKPPKFPDSTIIKNTKDAKSRTFNFTIKPDNVERQQVVKPLAMPPKKTRFFYEDLKQKSLPRGKFTANLLSGNIEDKSFAIIDIANEASLELVQTAIERTIGKSSFPPFEPEENELVVARYEGTLYRGVCKEVKPEGFLIHYIDYGNVELVQASDICKFHEKLLEFDLIVHQCLIENFPEQLDAKSTEILGGGQVEIVNAFKDAHGRYVATIVGL
jgi:hypothetical protein